MPNWCSNYLRVKGDEAAVEAFLLAATEGESLTLSRLVPVPESTTVDDQIAAWGTKWDIEPTEPYLDDTVDGCRTLEWVFDTAWAPPAAWLAKAARSAPTLTLTLAWDEPGVDFSGHSTWHGGEETSESSNRSISWGTCNVCLEEVWLSPTLDDILDNIVAGPEPTTFCENHQLEQAVAEHVQSQADGG